MFDYLKHKIKTYAVNPLTDMVHEKQEALARKTAERAATILFWLTAGLTGIFTLILVLLSLSLLIGQLLGSYLYGLFIFTALFILSSSSSPYASASKPPSDKHCSASSNPKLPKQSKTQTASPTTRHIPFPTKTTRPETKCRLKHLLFQTAFYSGVFRRKGRVL